MSNKYTPYGHVFKPSQKTIRKPARDPLVIQIEKASRSSKQYELDKLLREETKYKRRLTLAMNGLARVQQDIRDYLMNLSRHRLSEKAEGKE